MSNIETTPAPTKRPPPEGYIALEAPVEVIGGIEMVRSPDGGRTPLRTVKEQHKLEDQTVRYCVAFAMDLSARIARFKLHTFDDIEAFLSELDQKYGSKRGGPKGNVTLHTIDDCNKIEVKRHSLIIYGAELSTAKALVDEYINEKASDIDAELMSIIRHAFQVDEQGKISRSRLIQMKQLSITHPTWLKAMKALEEAERPAGSKVYVRFFTRPDITARWSSITIDLASA